MRRCETHYIQAGYCRHPEAMTIAGGGFHAAVFPALAGLFLHPNHGPVLFDTGYDPAFLHATNPFPERFYRWLTPPVIDGNSSVAAQLGHVGLTPHDIAWVVLSHFHGDHIAGLHAFPKVRIACSRAGLDWARSGGHIRALSRGVLRKLIPADIDARLRFFEDCPRIALPTSFAPFVEGADLFGDGSLIGVELPGHCPGHWGLAARAVDDRWHFHVADSAWSSRAMRENRPPPRVTTAFLGRTAPYRETLAKLNRMIAASPDLVVTPSHCAERAAQIRQETT